MPPREACLDILKRVARNFDNDRARLAKFDINFYALRKDGMYAGASLWNRAAGGARPVPRQFTVNTGSGARLEPCVYLLERT
jgi:hypothetical protein